MVMKTTTLDAGLNGVALTEPFDPLRRQPGCDNFTNKY
jgi:hypothetical protein